MTRIYATAPRIGASHYPPARLEALSLGTPRRDLSESPTRSRECSMGTGLSIRLSESGAPGRELAPVRTLRARAEWPIVFMKVRSGRVANFVEARSGDARGFYPLDDLGQARRVPTNVPFAASVQQVYRPLVPHLEPRVGAQAPSATSVERSLRRPTQTARELQEIPTLAICRPRACAKPQGQWGATIHENLRPRAWQKKTPSIRRFGADCYTCFKIIWQIGGKCGKGDARVKTY
jgi:hypothetical protein